MSGGVLSLMGFFGLFFVLNSVLNQLSDAQSCLHLCLG